jgi:hypothetical protein
MTFAQLVCCAPASAAEFAAGCMLHTMNVEPALCTRHSALLCVPAKQTRALAAGVCSATAVCRFCCLPHLFASCAAGHVGYELSPFIPTVVCMPNDCVLSPCCLSSFIFMCSWPCGLRAVSLHPHNRGHRCPAGLWPEGITRAQHGAAPRHAPQVGLLAHWMCFYQYDACVLMIDHVLRAVLCLHTQDQTDSVLSCLATHQAVHCRYSCNTSSCALQILKQTLLTAPVDGTTIC